MALNMGKVLVGSISGIVKKFKVKKTSTREIQDCNSTIKSKTTQLNPGLENCIGTIQLNPRLKQHN